MRWQLKCFLLVGVIAIGCSSIQKKEQARNRHALHQLFLANLHFRRPAGPGADPKVGPGGPDYFGSPVSDSSTYDCEPLSALHREMKMAEVRECLSSVKPFYRVGYRLRRDAVPTLEIADSELTPECMKKLLPVLPVP